MIRQKRDYFELGCGCWMMFFWYWIENFQIVEKFVLQMRRVICTFSGLQPSWPSSPKHLSTRSREKWCLGKFAAKTPANPIGVKCTSMISGVNMSLCWQLRGRSWSRLPFMTLVSGALSQNVSIWDSVPIWIIWEVILKFHWTYMWSFILTRLGWNAWLFSLWNQHVSRRDIRPFMGNMLWMFFLFFERCPLWCH